MNNFWLGLTVLVGVAAYSFSCGWVVAGACNAQEYCPPQACYSSAECGGGCTCLKQSGEGLGNCVGVNNE